MGLALQEVPFERLAALLQAYARRYPVTILQDDLAGDPDGLPGPGPHGTANPPSEVTRVAEHRGARLVSLGEALGDYAAQSQRRWATWLRKQRLADQFPLDFGPLLASIGEFADPVLLGEATGRAWNAAHLGWTPVPQLAE